MFHYMYTYTPHCVEKVSTFLKNHKKTPERMIILVKELINLLLTSSMTISFVLV